MPEPAILYNVLSNIGLMRRIEDIFKLTDEVLKHPQPNVALSPLFGKTSEVCQWQLQEKLLPHFLEWCAIDDRKMTAAGHSLLMMLPIPSVTYKQIRSISERVTATYRHYVMRHYRLGIDHARAMRPQPKLRIGYLSGDFRMHPVNYFVAGQFSNYDKQFVEVYCYSNLDASMEDDITEQYRRAVDSFVPVAGMDDVALAQRIAADGIHLLIDLSGYTGETRLGVMFHKSAPLQLTYLGYPFTTGLKEVDYVLSDPWLNGPNNASGFVEEILEIPHSFISFSDFPVAREDLTPPCRRNGYVTFGSLNNSYKLNRETVAAWSRILQQVPTSRLILNHPNYLLAITQENIFREFERHGIGRDRVSIITERHPKGRHLYWYLDIDIALDAFPQTGGTTTTEALWMGVPVVTLVGDVHYERLSYSVLKNCGTDIEDLIAFDLDAYIARAVRLAHDPERIAELHRVLPANIRHSLLCDPARQVRFYEEALIEGWNRKFPDQQKFTPETFAYARLNTPATPLVATVSDPDNLYRYVIEEQGRWFAPEYGLLKRMATHLDGQAVEIGAEPGFFGLELAHSGMRTLSLCASTVAGRQIRAAAEKGDMTERIEVRLESARSNLLDRAALENVALLRLGVEANDGNAGPVARNPAFWKSNAPVVLLSVHCDNQTDLSTAEKLAAMGYRLYRLLPGLGCFASYKVSEALDPYTLYLLACPPEREPPLVAAGILVSEPKPVAAEEVAALSNANQASDPWQQMDEWIVHCATQAREPGQDAAVRLGYLQLALRAQQTLMESAPSTTRRISLARLLSDFGHRAEAISLLNQSVTEIEQGSAQVTTPFLPPSATWDAIPAGDRLAEWLFAGLIETRCRLAAHTSYFLSANELEPLELLSSIGFETDFSISAQRARLAREGRQ
jgi:predicted O-linked N-acetylglucosamine transferase (SPINDLY family)